jgi:predicted transposase/invertase (TIGR01784 family)
MRFISANSKEDLDKLTQDSPHMQGAVDALLELNQDPQVRREFEYHEKMRRDAMSRERRMKREGIQEGRQEEKIDIARSLLEMGMSVEQVAKGTKLTISEIEKLKSQLTVNR